MDANSPIPNEDTLRQMPYSELREIAKKQGIKKRGSMKAEKLISKLLSSVSSDEMDSFSTPMANRINSSKKNKEKQFTLDAMTPLATPHRGTYSVETPIACVLPEKMEADSSSSPACSLTSPALDISNVTILRGSDRKLRPRKVSFVSPKKMTPRTPTKYISLKDRPKTPLPSKAMGRRTSLTPRVQLKKLDSGQKLVNGSSFLPKSATKEDSVTKKKSAATPSATTKSATKENTASKLKIGTTPNFRKIHQKAFEKMESIDDYQQRKQKESAKKLAVGSQSRNKITKPKTKIPAPFSGIPFIPSVTSCAGLRFNFASKLPKSFAGDRKYQTKSQVTVQQKGETENKRPLKSVQKPKFDLQASLSRKLGYKPYKGPVKPLCDNNCMNSPIPVCHHGAVKEVVNPVVHVARDKSRAALRGVRTNKRFDLQMKNRKLE